MFASPEPRANTSNCSADTVLQVDPAWSLPPAGGDAPRPSRQTNKPQRFSPEPVRHCDSNNQLLRLDAQMPN